MNIETKVFAHSSQVMSELADASVGLLLESPPYEGMHKCCGQTECGATHTGATFADWFSAFLPERHRVIADNGSYVLNFQPQVLGGFVSEAEYLLPKAVIDAGFRLVQTHIWHKTNTAPFASDKRLKVNFEFCWHFVKSSNYRFFKNKVREPHEWADRDPRKERYHPDGKDPGVVFTTSKSSDQAEHGHPGKMRPGIASRFIRLLSEPGDLIADGFAGTGQTGVEAAELGRKFVGFELHQEIAEAARRRLGIKENGEDWVMKEWLSSKEVAAYCGLALATIYSKTSRGEVPVHRGAGVPRYFKPEIDAWMRGERGGAVSPLAQEPAKES